MKCLLIVMVIVMFVFCGIMMYCLVDKIGGIKWDRQLPAVSCSTNVCNCANGSGALRANGEMTNKDALEILRNEQTNWLAVMGFFGFVFGFLAPVGSYLLQRQSLKDEQERIVKECNEKTEKAVKDALGKMKPMWGFLSSAFDYGLACSARRIGRQQGVDYADIVNFVIAFDICLDCLVRASLGPRVAEVVGKYRSSIEQSQTMHQAEWICAIKYLRGSGHPSEAFVTGAEYKKVLSDWSETYAWLKDFFSRIYPWKFG